MQQTEWGARDASLRNSGDTEFLIAVPSLHPAFLLRSSEGSEGQAKFFETVADDFRRAKALLARTPNWDERVIWRKDKHGRLINLFPDVARVHDFFRRAEGKLCAVDVETTGEQALACQLMCIGLACENGDALCIPVLSRGGAPYWTSGDWRRVFDCLRWFFGDVKTPKVFHNGPFDTAVLWAFGLTVFGWAEDTLAAHHVLDGELPHGLDYVASRYLEVPYWKAAVKGDVRWLLLDDEVLRSYNLRDCLATLRVLPPLLAELGRLELWELYREEVALYHEAVRWTLRGLFVDEKRRSALGAKLHKQKDEAIGHLQRIARSDTFNPASPMQLCEQLFEHLKFPIVKRTPKGNPSTDKDAMVLLAFRAKSPAQLDFLTYLVKWKRAAKFLSTWVEGLPILADGRLHVSWKLLPVTGRFSSSPNAQNWNNEIKALFCAEEGNDLVGADLDQAELRAMGYYAHDPELLHFYANGLNVHTINTTLLFGVRNPGQNTNDATEAFLTDAAPALHRVPYESLPMLSESQWKSARTLAKNFVFGHNYGAEAETLFNVIRSKRDDAGELLFANITLGEIEASKHTWEKLHPAIPAWWRSNMNAILKARCYRSPLSGRTRWFRAGFNRNEMLNFPIQEVVAAHMNRATLRIAPRLEDVTGARWGINSQVHDAIAAEVPQRHSAAVARIFTEELSRPFALPGYPEARFPPDTPKIAKYLNEV